jgi:hypothetical protein
LSSGRITLRDNDLSGDGSAGGPGSTGLACLGDSGSSGRALGNIINGFETGIENCRDDGNSL